MSRGAATAARPVTTPASRRTWTRVEAPAVEASVEMAEARPQPPPTAATAGAGSVGTAASAGSGPAAAVAGPSTPGQRAAARAAGPAAPPTAAPVVTWGSMERTAVLAVVAAAPLTRATA